MDDERAHGGGYCPHCHLGRLDVNAILIEKALDKQNGAYRNEDVFAKEQCDVVYRAACARIFRRVFSDSSP